MRPHAPQEHPFSPGPGRLLIVTVLAALLAAPGLAQWLQWGGPNRDFTVAAADLADSWPMSGPKKLWHRELGAGYSSIVVDDGVAYTMYRTKPTAEEEITIAVDARTGKTLWEHRNPAPLAIEPDARWGGLGPNSTPLVVGERLYTIGSLAVMHCFDKRTGKVLWKHDLYSEFDARRVESVGYSLSPIAYGTSVVVPVGHNQSEGHGNGPSLVAFAQESGNVVWQGLDFQVGKSSPILIRFAGRDHLVLFVQNQLLGVDPQDGTLLWHLPLRGYDGAPTPVWNGEDLLYIYAGGGDAGVSQVIQLAAVDGKTEASVLWATERNAFYVSTPVRIGDRLVGGAKKFFIGMDLKTGERLWTERGIEGASCVYADGKLILLDLNGKLLLTTVTLEGLKVHSQCTITEKYSLTAPTLVGTTLYVRDRRHMMALDLR